MEENLCMQWVALSANRREVYIATNYYLARNINNNGCFEKCSTQYRFIIPSCKIKKKGDEWIEVFVIQKKWR